MIRRLVLALTLAGATFASVGASPASATVPAVGSCHQLTLAQASDSSDPTPAVPCTGAHTTQTIAVVTSPTPLAGMTAQQMAEEGDALCVATLTRTVGPATLRAQTAYTGWFFAPTPEEIAAGESWFRCDVGLVNGAAFQQLPHHVLKTPIVTRHLPDNIRQCYAGNAETTCNHRHTQRSIGAFSTAKPFASKAAFNRVAHRKCPGATGYVFPTATEWRLGFHVIVCFKKTRH